MRAVKRWRYYCDFCKTSKGHKSAMEKHERRCTMNPDRECGLCIIKHGVSSSLSANVARLSLSADGRSTTLQDIRDATDNCPACILAIIRQRLYEFDPIRVDDKAGDFNERIQAGAEIHEFDYQAEVKSAFKDATTES